MKLFKTNNTDHVKYCQHCDCFCFDMPSDLWQKRVKAFESKFSEMYTGLPWLSYVLFGLLLYLFIVYLFFCIIATIIGEIKIYNIK